MEEKLVFLNKELIRDDILFTKRTKVNKLGKYGDPLEIKYIIIYVSKNYEIKKIILTLTYIYDDQYVSYLDYEKMTPEQKIDAQPFMGNLNYVNTELLIENDDEHFVANRVGLDKNKNKHYFPMIHHVSAYEFFDRNKDIEIASKGSNEYCYYLDSLNYKKWLERSKTQPIAEDLDNEIALRPSSAITREGQIRYLKIMDDIASGSYNNIDEIENLVYKKYAKLSSKTFRAEYDKVFISEEIDPYIASHKFKLQIVRSPETPDNAFDYIKVEFSVISRVKMEWLKANYKPIAKKAILFIEKNKQFQKFGVPSNILKLENIFLSKDKTVNFTFGIKELS